MEGMHAYQTFIALKLHFTTDSYDYIKYNGKTRPITEEALKKRKDYNHLRRVERKYADNIVDYIVANFVSGQSGLWTTNFSSLQCEKNYVDWKQRHSEFPKLFKADLAKISAEWNKSLQVVNGGHPPLLKQYLGKKIYIETVIAMNEILNFLPYWDKQIQDTIIWADVSRMIKKYRPFVKFNLTEVKSIMREVLL